MFTPHYILRLFIVLMLTTVFGVRLLAQNASYGSEKNIIAYQSPNNGDTDVPERTTLIVRPDATVVRGHSAQDFSFDVRGESSGEHLGKVLISDDNETIIFKPNQPFILHERVNVAFSIAAAENIPLTSYSFRITSISEQEQKHRLTLFRESEERENPQYLGNEIQDQTNDTIKPSMFVVDILVPEKVAPGNIFTTRNGVQSFIETLDNQASSVFRRQTPHPICENFRPWPNKTLSYNNFGQVFLLDSNCTPIDTFMCGNGYQTDDHEFQLLPNGHTLLMANDTRDTDMRVITGDSNSTMHGTVIGGIIQELDTQKNVVFQWRSWDHFSIRDDAHSKINDPNLRFVDYCHLNSIEEDADGNIIASFRAMDEVTKISRKSKDGKIIWRWGGKNSYFTFAPGSDTMNFCSQHDVRRIANGHITMMDNGNYRTSVWGDGSYHDTAWSRAIEYELDEGNLTAKAVWQYSNIDNTPSAGSVQRLPNGNTFICSGSSGLQKAIEVSPDGEKVFQLSYPVGDFTFRACRYTQPLPPLSVVPLPANRNLSAFRGISPNPAQNSVTITFFTQKAGDAQIDLLDVLGHTVGSMKEKLSGAGAYSSNLDLRGLPAGMYYCRLSQGGHVEVKPIIVRK